MWCADNFSVILHHSLAQNYFCPQKLNSLQSHNTVSNQSKITVSTQYQNARVSQFVRPGQSINTSKKSLTVKLKSSLSVGSYPIPNLFEYLVLLFVYHLIIERHELCLPYLFVVYVYGTSVNKCVHLVLLKQNLAYSNCKKIILVTVRRNVLYRNNQYGLSCLYSVK